MNEMGRGGEEQHWKMEKGQRSFKSKDWIEHHVRQCATTFRSMRERLLVQNSSFLTLIALSIL